MITTIFIVIVAGFLYFLPIIVAWKKKHIAGIAILNIALGWTVLGWLAALIWAVSDSQDETPRKRYDC